MTVLGFLNLISSYAFLPDTKNINLDMVHPDKSATDIEQRDQDETTMMMDKK